MSQPSPASFHVEELHRALSEELQSSTICAFSLSGESAGISASASVTLLEDRVINVELTNQGYSYVRLVPNVSPSSSSVLSYHAQDCGERETERRDI
ncbi:hypothetical protein D9758_006822 [Tetrapyrgos nigripes]|uniref:GSKIP domain-containing protein n=1 Tax=Tetrapyrgos nigripes TaxID=182062 RepID=A0A8H5FTJ8_9AGAR|nr:hypothetical protein D9758_006822 [Tetrapyrgos nigripes]